MIRMMGKTSSPPPGTTTPMTTLSGYTKGTVTSESQAALNIFKKHTKRDASAYYIFKNDLYYDTFQRSFLATIKAQGLYGVADPDFDPYHGDQYDQQLFEEKQSLYILYWLMFSRQKREGNYIISKFHHYHTQSNVAQHEVITLTTYKPEPY